MIFYFVCLFHFFADIILGDSPPLVKDNFVFRKLFCFVPVISFMIVCNIQYVYSLMCPVNESNMYLTNKTQDMKTSSRLLLTLHTNLYSLLLIFPFFTNWIPSSPPTKISPTSAVNIQSLSYLRKFHNLPKIIKIWDHIICSNHHLWIITYQANILVRMYT